MPPQPQLDSPMWNDRTKPDIMTDPDRVASMHGPEPRQLPNGDLQVYREPEESKPGFWGKLGAGIKKAAPDMLTAAMASLATPSQYGGGPVDIGRAMLAGQQAIKNRDLMAYNMEREKLKDQMEREKHTSTIKSQEAASRANEAASEASKARAERDKVEAKKQSFEEKLVEQYALETDPVKKEAIKQQIIDLRHGRRSQTRWAPTGAGSVVNTESGEIKQVGPDPVEMEAKKKQERFDWLRSRKDKSLPDPKTGKPMYTRPPEEFWRSLSPEDQIFINTGKEPQAKTDMSTSEIEMALIAEGHVPGTPITREVADRAQKRLQASKRSTAASAEDIRRELQVDRMATQEEQEATAEYGKVEEDFAKAWNALHADGVRPGSKKGREEGLTEAEWALQKNNLIDQANRRKNILHQRIEKARRLRDPEYRSIGSDPYRRETPPAPPAPAPGGGKKPAPEQAAAPRPEGEVRPDLAKTPNAKAFLDEILR
jgi:hypothetical protein